MEQQILCPKCKTPLKREEIIEPVSNKERKVILSKLMDFKLYKVIVHYCPTCNREIRKKVPVSSFEYSKLNV